MGHILDLVLNDDYPPTEKSMFDLVDSKYIYEEDGEKILSVTDELIDELANSDIPNQDFLSSTVVKNEKCQWRCRRYSLIVGYRVLARRGYPRIKDVLKIIFTTACLGCEDAFNGVGELRQMVRAIPKEVQVEYIKEKIPEDFYLRIWEPWNSRGLYEWIEYMRTIGITKAVFNDDVLWEQILNILKDLRSKVETLRERWGRETPQQHVQLKYFNSLIKFMESSC